MFSQEIPVNRLKNNKGQILIIVMGFIVLMIFTTVSLSFMMQQDVRLVERVKQQEQARLIAEAGINHALVKMNDEGYPSFPQSGYLSGSLDIGSYNVDLLQTGGRHLVVSTGTVSGVSEDVSVEVKDNTPTALNYFSGAGANIKIKIHTNVNDGSITGDIHANNDVFLSAQNNANLTVTGEVSATGIVQEGTKHYDSDNRDSDVIINGLADDQATVYEGEDQITFPEFDYAAYRQAASDDGILYESDKDFGTETLSPSNGIVYVDGDVIISGTLTLNGTLAAESINIAPNARLNQIKNGNNNVVIARDGDITIRGFLSVEEALIYASQDIISRENWGPTIQVNGILLAGRDILIWNVKTHIYYTYVYITPPNMTEESAGVDVVSWNE
jgi:cytoskeletal protein CcmA (bactofilin family)